MAVVYRAEDLLLGREVAVKVPREQYASDAAFLARLEGEARAAASLSHPNIAAVYDVGSDGDTRYIVMELVAGRTLKEIVRQEAPLGAARTIDLGCQICRALEHAHRHGIIHRDVKPHNVLVTPDGQAKVVDFGIAVAPGASSLTQPGSVIGSAHYISPEQARGEPATPHSDLYSVGVVLYEMATGDLPFDGETAVAVALRQLREDPVPPRRRNPRIPASLQSAIIRAMAKEPAERFASCAEMSGALEECARAGQEATQPLGLVSPEPAPRATMPPSGRRDPPREGPRGLDLRRPAVLAILALLAAALLALGAIPSGLGSRLGGIAPGHGQDPVAWVPPSPGSIPTPVPVPSPTPTRVPPPTATPTTAKAPPLVGLPLETARQRARDSGLELVVAGEARSAAQPAGHVLSQKPEAGSAMEQGGRVEVVVSLGVERVEVPRVVGEPLPVAAARLLAAGLRWRLADDEGDEEDDHKVPSMVVISQSPGPGAAVERGSEVVLTLAKRKGPPPKSDR